MTTPMIMFFVFFVIRCNIFTPKVVTCRSNTVYYIPSSQQWEKPHEKVVFDRITPVPIDRLYYCKRAILCLASSKILNPTPLFARRVCPPSATKAGGVPLGWIIRCSIYQEKLEAFWPEPDLGPPPFRQSRSSLYCISQYGWLNALDHHSWSQETINGTEKKARFSPTCSIFEQQEPWLEPELSPTSSWSFNCINSFNPNESYVPARLIWSW